MHIISPHHLAELLIGIARAQAAIVRATGNETTVARALQKAADSTLTDLPARILLASLAGSGPNAATVAEELEGILGGTPGSPGGDLDFSGSPP
jgi:hypothetical protein